MGFPSKNEIKRALKAMEKKEGTLSLPEHPTALQQFRWDICQLFIEHILENKFSQKQLANLIEIDEAKMSKILNHRIDEFSTDRLITLYEKINPNLKLKVS